MSKDVKLHDFNFMKLYASIEIFQDVLKQPF